VQGQRFSRPRNRDAYAEWLQGYVAQRGRMDEPITSESDRLFETFMLGLRQSCGVDLAALGEGFSCDQVERLRGSLKIYEDKGWVIFSADGRMCLSDPDGFLFSNTVLVSLWESLLEHHNSLKIDQWTL
jgi:coproporphyrinogen III oxidase-like Fe-S oxidoreductase